MEHAIAERNNNGKYVIYVQIYQCYQFELIQALRTANSLLFSQTKVQNNDDLPPHTGPTGNGTKWMQTNKMNTINVNKCSYFRPVDADLPFFIVWKAFSFRIIHGFGF